MPGRRGRRRGVHNAEVKFPFVKPPITERERSRREEVKQATKVPRCQSRAELKIGQGPWGQQGLFRLGRLSPCVGDDDDDDDDGDDDDDHDGGDDDGDQDYDEGEYVFGKIKF